MQEIQVTVHQHRSTGLLVALSKDLPGLSIAGHTIDEIESELEPVVRALLEARGEKVEVLTVLPAQMQDPSGFVSDARFIIVRSE